MNRFYIAFPIFPPTAISQIMVGLTITHHIPFTEIFLLIKGHLLTWIAELWWRRLLLLPPIRAAEYGSFKKLESRYHAIIFHALRCLRNDVECLSWSLLRKIPPIIRVCVCKSYRSRFVYLVIYTVQSHSCILWGGAIMAQCIRHRPIITNRFRRTMGCCSSHSIVLILMYVCTYVLLPLYQQM